MSIINVILRYDFDNQQPGQPGPWYRIPYVVILLENEHKRLRRVECGYMTETKARSQAAGWRDFTGAAHVIRTTKGPTSVEYDEA